MVTRQLALLLIVAVISGFSDGRMRSHAANHLPENSTAETEIDSDYRSLPMSGFEPGSALNNKVSLDI